MAKRYAVILAAGQGSRMKSKLYKVLHPVAGKPMVGHVAEQLEEMSLDKIVTIVGHGAEKVKDYLGQRVDYALQEEQLGTAHAVQQARSLLMGEEGTTVVVSGDTPLLTAESLNAAFGYHEKHQAKVTVLSAHVENSFGYGRVIRDEDGSLDRIIEEKDATDEERLIREINTGTYFFDNEALFNSLNKVENNNAQGEYYLPDVIEILKEEKERVEAYSIDDVSEALGVNDRKALSQAEMLMRERINEKHMTNGVTLINPQSTYIDSDVEIGKDTVIEPNVYLKGSTAIGEDCVIGINSVIIDSQIGNQSIIQSSTIDQSTLETEVTIGPNAHIRPNSTLKDQVHIGNFVEVKNSLLGKGTKSGHLTYIGDADVGEKVNFGCGTIVVNYDGHKKHRTTIGDNAFIGCNVNLISPLVLEPNTFIAAGSTITKDVPEDALALERAEEIHIQGYVSRQREKWEKGQ
ncbi:MAG: bifunctional UDP-N-acetylglucosamine diphosphorylase/glucosamine-1-phosphate N-acetyltransferase GlmU [Atopococcus tabaci]|uniref:Bifunctional protein GlmU n=1 Tax=Atopococcus tabaci TaxID=269774 RepID=A0AA43UBZ7_9LACT|nr:bifunctional UDP-N-acetylglucosamine diphosphorylase/glucosamine-1-phosphate N-acetyltransferase GlmU [Atopococcus tabaci]